jgi:sugar/nucleoside kinase (ribokinase family)
MNMESPDANKLFKQDGHPPLSTRAKPAPQCDVLLFADYFCDVIITGLPEPPRLGADLYGEAMEIAPGGAYILAHWLHCLGVEVHWAARFGNDIFSRFILDESTRVGLNTSLFQVYPQPYRVFSLSFSFAHDRGFISFNDPAPAELPRHELILSQRPRWVVNPPFDGSAECRALMDLVHQQGGRVFVDCQYTTATLTDPGLAETLRKVDIFAPNLSEASQLTGETQPLAALASLSEFCPLVILKCGGQGAYARRGDQIWHSPALDVEVVDTTGAGDSFNAGFLAGLLAGEPIETCLRYGNICGGISTTCRGGSTTALTLAEVRQIDFTLSRINL